MRLLLLRIPNDDDLFDINVGGHLVFFQVKDISFDFSHFTADGNSLAANLDFLAQTIFKKIPHGFYSFANLVSLRR